MSEHAYESDGFGLCTICGAEQKHCVLTAERDRLRAALEWYADPEMYKDQDNSCGNPECCTPYPHIPAVEDEGERARTALASDKGGA